MIVFRFILQTAEKERNSKMKKEANRNGALAVETWISLSENGGCDAGWNVIAEHDSLDVIADISDPKTAVVTAMCVKIMVLIVSFIILRKGKKTNPLKMK